LGQAACSGWRPCTRLRLVLTLAPPAPLPPLLQVSLRMKRHKDAFDQACRAVALDHQSSKALFQRAAAREVLGDLKVRAGKLAQSLPEPTAGKVVAFLFIFPGGQELNWPSLRPCSAWQGC
jgi:hypothetical protein